MSKIDLFIEVTSKVDVFIFERLSDALSLPLASASSRYSSIVAFFSLIRSLSR